MKKILIIYPHFPPSNLAGVHRARLFAQHLPKYHWEPTILTVDEKFYEEELDWGLVQLIPKSLRIEKVNAFRITKPRLIGDIGMRAFFQLYKKAKRLIQTEKVDFVYIPIPSFYVALLGRGLNYSTGVKYGVDYIDPWVHDFPGSNKIFSRHWWSKKIATLLEPIAIKKASLITGVAAGYYEAVVTRNPHLKNRAVIGAMPYGGEKADHEQLHKIELNSYLFQKKEDKITLLYAGAMLPKAFSILDVIFKSIQQHKEHYANIEFHFIGTGYAANDANSFNIKSYAEKYGLWNSVVFEYPKRIPYLSVLKHLQLADGIFILGSTEAHYTPSKSYQAVISEKPILAVLHQASTAVKVLIDSKAGMVLEFNGEEELSKVEESFNSTFKDYLQFIKNFNPSTIKQELFEEYSAKAVTKKLADLLDQAVSDH